MYSKRKMGIGALIGVFILAVAGFLYMLNQRGLLGMSADQASNPPVVDAQTARKVADAWLKDNPSVMLKKPDGKNWKSRDIRTFKDKSGNTVLAYIVDLDPEGYIVVPAYQSIEPILAFSESGTFSGEYGEDQVLADVISQDVPDRLYHPEKTSESYKDEVGNKWKKLATVDATTTTLNTTAVIPTISPLIKDNWNQNGSNPITTYTYNYFTPNHVYTGCVATAMGMILHYFNYPASASGTNTIFVNGTGQSASFNDTYDYTQMPTSLTSSSTEAQVKETAKLLYDAGISVQMQYSSTGSGAYMGSVVTALKNTFGYASASWENGTDPNWQNLLKNELAAGYPVTMGIQSSSGAGHAIISDGWGTDGTNNLYHLNLGWGGTSNGWYSVPGFSAGGYTWTVLQGYAYNIRKPSSTDTSLPTISISSPFNGTTVSGTATILSKPADNVGVTKVEFYNNNALVDTETGSSGWSYLWDTTKVTNGTYTISAKAYDAAGNIGVSAPVNLTVDNSVASGDIVAPSVSITFPTDGAKLSSRGNTTISAKATDNVAVAKMELYFDSKLVASSTSGNLSYSLNPKKVSTGAHAIQAKAYDAAGNSTSSSIVSVTK